MATDYDAPRKSDFEIAAESLQELQERDAERKQAAVAIDEDDTAEGIELPGADLSQMSLDMHVVPQQADECVCPSCFLVKHVSQWAAGSRVCVDCA
jgi:3-dehydroquinate synthase class II